ncbi:hypothetical protein Pla110_44860 [Polystyrenella longa]|uniref:Uncharacterized protein n=1 Tax=Polystyrenella longa TaxID=2528007 RepID=A0A518CU63_9PLAN|nr:hypothetical protein Pla110_44860 [Polystyrenella longa]
MPFRMLVIYEVVFYSIWTTFQFFYHVFTERGGPLDAFVECGFYMLVFMFFKFMFFGFSFSDKECQNILVCASNDKRLYGYPAAAAALSGIASVGIAVLSALVKNIFFDKNDLVILIFIFLPLLILITFLVYLIGYSLCRYYLRKHCRQISSL